MTNKVAIFFSSNIAVPPPAFVLVLYMTRGLNFCSCKVEESSRVNYVYIEHK